jgi:hypothetical protein
LEEEYKNLIASQKEILLSIQHADAVSSAILQHTDAEGMLKLQLPYQVIPFVNGSYGTPMDGVTVFKVKVR